MLEKLHPGRTVEAPTPPQFKFVYAVHDKEHSDETWNMVKDCDVILQEQVLDSQSEREKMEKMIALATFRPQSSVGSALRAHFLSKGQLGWNRSLVANSIEAGREFHFVDVMFPSPEIEILEKAETLHRLSAATLGKGKPFVALGQLEMAIEKYALSNRLRSQAIVRQVGSLLEKKHKNWAGKRIGVVLGIVHQPLSETFRIAFPNYEVERKVMKTISPTIKDAIMEKELYPEKPVNRNLLKRVLISDAILFNYLKTINPHVNSTELCDTVDEIGASLSKKAVNRYWYKITEFAGNKDLYLDSVWDAAAEICTNFESKKAALDS